MNLLRRIYRELLGYKYYGVLIDDGYRDYISSNIFTTRRNAVYFARELGRECRSLRPAGIISFRVRHKLTQLDGEINR